MNQMDDQSDERILGRIEELDAEIRYLQQRILTKTSEIELLEGILNQK